MMVFIGYCCIVFAIFVLLTFSISIGVSVGMTIFYEKFFKGK